MRIVCLETILMAVLEILSLAFQTVVALMIFESCTDFELREESEVVGITLKLWQVAKPPQTDHGQTFTAVEFMVDV